MLELARALDRVAASVRAPTVSRVTNAVACANGYVADLDFSTRGCPRLCCRQRAACIIRFRHRRGVLMRGGARRGGAETVLGLRLRLFNEALVLLGGGGALLLGHFGAELLHLA